MKLYSRAISPFAARVRISILAKQLPVAIVNDPDLLSDAFGEINPMRKVPVLVFDDGRSLPESEAIVEYFEDRFPEVSLRPADLFDCARARVICRAAELYLFPAVVDIFRALGAQSIDREDLNVLLEALRGRLHELSQLLGEGGSDWNAVGTRLSIADGALVPFLFYVEMLGSRLGQPILDAYPRLAHFMKGAERDSALSAVTAEISAAMQGPRT